MTLSQAMRDAIERFPHSQYRLAQLSGVTQIQISRFMRDPKQDIRLSTASKLAPVLGLRLSKIPGGIIEG